MKDAIKHMYIVVSIFSFTMILGTFLLINFLKSIKTDIEIELFSDKIDYRNQKVYPPPGMTQSTSDAHPF